METALKWETPKIEEIEISSGANIAFMEGPNYYDGFS